MRSKIELRLEAARLAVQLPETTMDNFHERVYRIGLYLQGDAELPEHVDDIETLKMYLNEQVKSWEEQNQKHQHHVEELLSNVDTRSFEERYINTAWAKAYTSPNGIPSSEGEAMFLQEDGEKVE